MSAFSRFLFLVVLASLLVLAGGRSLRPAARGRQRTPLAGMRMRRGRSRATDSCPTRPTRPWRQTVLPPGQQDETDEARAAHTALSVELHEHSDQRSRSHFFEPLSGTRNLATPLYLSLHVLVI